MLKYIIVVVLSTSYLTAVSSSILEIGSEIFKRTPSVFNKSGISRRYVTKIGENVTIVPVTQEILPSFMKIGLRQFERQSRICPAIWASHEDISSRYLLSLNKKIQKPNSVMYGVLKDENPQAFLVGQYITPPGVYAPGLTLLVQEAQVKEDSLWPLAGSGLLSRLREEAREKNATQWVFTNDSAQGKKFDELMQEHKLNICSQWWTGKLTTDISRIFQEVEPIAHEDLEKLVALSAEKRKAYALVQPLFWKPDPRADEVQYEYFCDLIKEKSTLGYVFRKDKEIQGFIIGEVYPPSQFYSGARLCKVDDYTVKNDKWDDIGYPLLQSLYRQSSIEGADYVYVVSGFHHLEKQEFLARIGLKKVSDTWTGAL